WKQNYILVDEYFFFCCTWIVNSADKLRSRINSRRKVEKNATERGVLDCLLFLAGCGVNALSGLQKHANSIYCRDHVGLISVAHQAI
ncbi:hypothetical protein, partial [Escherichia coli]|uniref:hypothetical protein n=1 Tax=Escherichia coli TaxID=562 RepID=UPI001BD3AB07